MMNVAALSPKRRAAAARKVLEDFERAFGPPIPEESAVVLKAYGTVWKGQSALRVVLVKDKAADFAYQLRLERHGPAPEDIVVDPQRGRQLREAVAAAFVDLGDFNKLINRPASSAAAGGRAELSERDLELLRIFAVELAPKGVLAARNVTEATEQSR